MLQAWSRDSPICDTFSVLLLVYYWFQSFSFFKEEQGLANEQFSFYFNRYGLILSSTGHFVCDIWVTSDWVSLEVVLLHHYSD